MEPFYSYIPEYRKQLEKGQVKAAFKGLMEYFTQLRQRLKSKHPDYFNSDVHYGLMDYTYFYFFPKTLQRKKLKIVVLFNHDTFKVEAWLAGYNKKAQAAYLRKFKENGWRKTPLPSSINGVDYITTSTLAVEPDFSLPVILTSQIETRLEAFTKDIQDFLARNIDN